MRVHAIFASLASLASLAAAAPLAGCDGGVMASPDLAVASPCSGTLSGAVSVAITGCRVTWDEKSGEGVLGNDGVIAVSDPTAIVDDDTFGFSMTIDGDAHTGTFDFASVTDAAAGVYVNGDAGSTSYAAFTTQIFNGPPTFGAVSVHLTGTVVDFTHADEKQWIVHGHLDATFVHPPPSALTDSVTMALDF